MYTSHGPPPYYSNYDSTMPHGYYSPRYTVHTATPSPRPTSKHQRRATQEYQYATPRRSSYQYAEYVSPGYTTHQRKTDHIPTYTRVDDYDYPTHRTSRPRRASYATKPQPTPTKPRTSAPKSPPKATDDDARRAGIPAGYSFKNWDPTEEPILLLGSVFDANSLGKWIYDWTVAWHGPGTPMSEIAGDLWLLLIQLAGKIKRAEDGLPKIRREANKEMIEDFLESGERLWERFNKLLKVCEAYMLKAAQKDRSGKPLQMGKKSGCEFVDTIFGRDRQLEGTEKLMTGIRLWSMRFDANCEDVLRKS